MAFGSWFGGGERRKLESWETSSRPEAPAEVLARTSGITFAVDPVEPAALPLGRCKGYAGVTYLIGSHPEACSDWSGDVVVRVDRQPLIKAIHLAFAEHRPLVLTPDALWVTIIQGFAAHVAKHQGRLRERLVRHREGKKELLVARDDFVRGSPENDWASLFEHFGAGLREEIGAELHDLLVGDFSTTGPAERAAFRIGLMDVFEPYYDYGAVCVCGIPTVTLEGTVDDWRSLTSRVRQLTDLDGDLSFWTEKLLPVCEQLERSAAGEPDLAFWRRIYKLEEAYGSSRINGWVLRLLPYIQGQSEGLTEPNPFLTHEEHELLPFMRGGLPTSALPKGLSSVPMSIKWADGNEQMMQLFGGLVGVTQDSETLGLRPKLGWAVRPAPPPSDA